MIGSFSRLLLDLLDQFSHGLAAPNQALRNQSVWPSAPPALLHLLTAAV